MSTRSLIPALLCAVPLLLPACDGGGSGGNGGSQTGGTTASGGTTTASGGSGAGGTTTAAGGTTAAAGGTTTSGGARSGGTTSSGGTTASGGTIAGTGGATPATGGRTSGTSGSTSATGGSATAGATSGTGGARNGGATTAGGATGNGGVTVAGGRTGAGGATGAGGSTGAVNEVWVSPTGNDDTGTGTKDSPLFSLCWDDSDNSIKKGACYKLCPVGTGCTTAGGTIWVMDGTYKYKATQKFGSSKLGTASAPFKVLAASGAKPVLDFSALTVDDKSRGLQVQGDYWHFKGLTVTNAGDTGIFVMGNNNTIEQCIAHHNKDAGIVIGVNGDRSGSGSNNLILNCDSYQNNDTQTNGENADGFGAKENSAPGNAFRGCRAWDNADDGWDFYGWGAPITVENCWAISQAKTTKGSSSDGNGFKLGGDDVSAKHVLKGLYATDNSYASSKCGFTNNNNPAALSCDGCAAWSNGTDVKGVSGVGTTAPSGATAAKMIAAQRNADGSLPDISSL